MLCGIFMPYFVDKLMLEGGAGLIVVKVIPFLNF